MRIATTKFMNSRVGEVELSPARKPRFQRTEKCQSTASRLHSKSQGQLSLTPLPLSNPHLNINMRFVAPVIHDGSTSHSPLKHTQQQTKLGLLIKARINKYKRETTPLKSQSTRRQRDTSSHLQKLLFQLKELESIIDQKELEIAQLEDQNQKLLQKLEKTDKTNTEKTKLIQTCMNLRRELQEKQNKLFHLQSSFKQNQDFLLQTKDSLEKLKRSMEQYKIAELVKERELLLEKIGILEKRVGLEHEEVMKMDVVNSKLVRDMEVMTMTNQKLERQLFARSNVADAMKEECLNKEISALKMLLASGKSEGQRQLEQIIARQQSEISDLKETNKTLFVKLDITLKRLQQKQKSSKKAKSKQLAQLQAKFRKFLLEYKNFRQQHNEILRRNIHMSQENQRNTLDDQDSFSYSLTPQKDNC